VHQYKFIVDTRWVYSKHHSIFQDEKGNINNIIDTTKLPDQESEKTTIKDQPGKKEQTHMDDLKKNLTEIYTEYFPSKGELNLDAPNVPTCYAKPFDIDMNSHQHLLGNSKFLNFSILNDQNENNSFKNIALVPHVNL
jgi:hypothetical protein